MNATIRRGIPGCFYDDVFLISKSSMRHGITYWRLVVLTLVGSLSCNGLARDHDIAALADLDRETLQSYLTLDPSDTLVRLLMAERTLSNDLLATAALLDLNRTELNSDQQLYFDALKCQLDLYNGANPQTLAVCNDLSVAEAAAVAPYVAAQAFRGWAMQAFCAEDIGSMLARSRQAVVAARRSESRRALISALNGNAIALHKAGAVDAALRQFEQARLLINPAIDQDLLGRLTFNNGTAQIYAGQGDAAAEVFTAALADPTNKAPTIQLKIRNNLAEAHLLRSDPDAAVSSLEAYLVSLDPDSVSVDALLRARLTLAEAQLRTGNGEGALELHQGSQLQIGRALSPDQSMELKRAVAEAQLSLGNTSVAVSLLEEVTGHFRQQDSGWLLLPALDSLALAYAREARFSDAYAMQLEHAALQASLHSARFDQQLAVQRTQLEADNAEFQQRLRAQEVQARTAKNSLDRTRWASSAMVLALIIALLYLLANRHLRNRELAAKASESEELERLVVERTNDLEKELSARLLLQDERRQLEITLAESDKLRTIGQLTSGVAHDFNNLMTVVTLSAELIDLEADRLSSRQAQALRDIMVATNSAANITSQLLAYARQQPLQPEQLNLRDYLNQSRNLFQSTLGEQLTLHLAAADCSVEVDRTSLTTALLHLLSNAREATTGSGRVEISVDTAPPAVELAEAPEQRPAAWAVVRVSDTGSGMSTEAKARAVEPFFTTKGQQNRSGLGLSMAFGFAQQSGGDLRIADRAGGGTEVSLYLPLAAGARSPQSTQRAAPADEPVSGRVLLVEDKAELRNALARLIEAMGLKVASAEDASSALDYLQREPLPDLLLTDVVMPGELNGKELAEAAIAQYPALRVLLMSGYSDIASGDFAMLRKPFSLEELRREIRAQLPESCAA